jgi:hypothetical protein
MSNIKKILENKKEKKPRVPRTKKIKFDIINAPDAIVEGKLIVPPGTKVIIPRLKAGRESLSKCEIMKVDDDGVIHTWDETLNQWYLFRVTDNIVVKIIAEGVENDKLRRCYS